MRLTTRSHGSHSFRLILAGAAAVSGLTAVPLSAQGARTPGECVELETRYRAADTRVAARAAMRDACAPQLGRLVAEHLSSWMIDARDDQARTELLRDALLSPSESLADAALGLLDAPGAPQSHVAAGFVLLTHSGSARSSAAVSLALIAERYAKMGDALHGLWCKDYFDSRRYSPKRTARAFRTDTLLADRIVQVLRSSRTDRFSKAMALCSHTSATLEIPLRLEASDLVITYRCDNIWNVVIADSTLTGWIQYGPVGSPGVLNSSVTRRESLLRLPFAADLWVANRGRELLRVPHGHRSCRAQRLRDSGEPIPADLDTLAGWQWRSFPGQARPSRQRSPQS